MTVELGDSMGVTVSDAAGELLVLRKARDNKMWVHEVGDVVYDNGRPLKSWLLPHYQRLLHGGQLMIVARRYPTGISERVELTPAGRERLWSREGEWRPGQT